MINRLTPGSCSHSTVLLFLSALNVITLKAMNLWYGLGIRVDFHRALQSNNQKFDPFIFYWKSRRAGQYHDVDLPSAAFCKLCKHAFCRSIQTSEKNNAERSGTGSLSRFLNIHSGCPHPPQCCAGLHSIPSYYQWTISVLLLRS